MPSLELEPLIHRIHRSGHRFVLVMTGGSGAIGQLLSVPGGSRSVLEAAVPYSAAALTQWLGAAPEHFCDERTARTMAMAAYLRAVDFDPAMGQRQLLAGISCTASLTSDRPKRGPHRAHLAVQTANLTATWSLELSKGARTRQQEEELASTLTLNAIAAGCGLSEQAALALRRDERVILQQTEAPAPWQDLLSGKRTHYCQCGSPRSPAVVFPGAFNPRHAGHIQMAAMAAEILGQPVAHELSLENVDKPLLDFRELEVRAAQFNAGETLWLTRAPTFVQKGRLFPGATFVVGLDTIVRIADPRYYDGDAGASLRAIDELVSLGCRFLVFGRHDDRHFQTLDEVPLPASLAALCVGVPAERFRVDISSTKLRQQGSGDLCG